MTNATDYDRMSPEFALVQALGTVPVIADPSSGEPKVGAMQPRQNWKPPFLFYIPSADAEEETLDGPTGLQSFTATLHCVAGTHRGLQLLCQRCKKAMLQMRGAFYSTPDPDSEEGPKGLILVENVTAEQVSPDLLEMEVGLYRRMYTIRIDYQTEEVWENED